VPDDKGVSRRDFLGAVAKLGLTAASMPLAMKVLWDFERHALSQNAAMDPRQNSVEAQYWEAVGGGKTGCRLCPKECTLGDGVTGFCWARANQGGKMRSHVWNNPVILNIDPVEKSPLNHFLPATKAVAFGTATCLDMDKNEVHKASLDKQCKSICYTYTDPVVSVEYLKDVSAFAKSKGVKNIVCTAGYVNEKPLKDVCKTVDAFSVTLKGFDDDFYQKVCGRKALGAVLKTIQTVKEQKVWLEVINLIVPTYNDDMGKIREMCKWLKKNAGGDTPLHFGRFVPEYKLKELPQTPVQTLDQARNIGLEEGLKFVYLMNVAPHDGNNTYCPKCRKAVVKRLAFKILENNVTDGKCKFCGQKLPGVWK
jgi:pyruvate formate lyase activating enzyme